MFRKILAGLDGLFRRRRHERELDDELASLMEHAADAHEERGLAREDAVQAARRELGSLAAARDEVAAGLWETTIFTAWRDARYGARLLRRTPGFTAVAVATLALGTGATAAFLSVANDVLLRPLPVERAEELVVFGWHAGPRAMPPVSIAGVIQDPVTGRSTSTAFSLFAFERFASSATALSGLLAWSGVTTPPSVPGLNDGSYGHLVSGNYFTLLGTSPHLGRLLTPADDQISATPVIVISHRAWQQTHGAREDILGQQITFAAGAATIVGVTAPRFSGLGEVNRPAEYFVPLAAGPALMGDRFATRMHERWVWPVRIFGRLRPGFSAEEVRAQLQGAFNEASLAAWNAQPSSGTPPGLPVLEITPGSQGLTVARVRQVHTLQILALIVAAVLAIVCVNVAGLLVARGESRHAEAALRLALGASRARVFRQFVVESTLLAGLGASFGLALAAWSRPLLVALITRADPTFVVEPRLDLQVLAAVAGLTLAAGVLIGVLPAVRAARVKSAPAGNRAFTRRRAVATRALVATQIALSMALIAASGLLVQTLRRLESTDVGFDADRLILFNAAVRPDGPKATAQWALETYRALEARLAALPGVDAATHSEHALLGGDLAMPTLSVPGRPKAADEDRTVFLESVSPSFFATMGMPLQAGRGFTAADVGRPVVVVNDTLARRFFGGADAIGRRIGITKDASAPEVAPANLAEIVGIVRDAKYLNVREAPMLTVFRPMSTPVAMTFAVRASGTPSSVVAAVEGVVKTMPSIVAGRFRTQTEQMSRTYVRERDLASLALVFGTLALVLTSIGVYGLLSYRVAERTREFGVCLALGAARHRVVGSVLGETAAVLVVGLAVGLVGASALTRALNAYLYGVHPLDPLALGAAVGVLITVAVVASVLPARRAARIDPVVALRTE